MSATKIWLTARDLQDRGLGEKSTLYRKYKRGEFPPPSYIGEKRVWRLEVIEKWEAEQLARGSEARRADRNLKSHPEAAPAA
jgi:predicted DNA-binding transcriptional regulator AlpA